MGKDNQPKPVKPIQERVKESIDILNKLKILGFSEMDEGYMELSKKFNDWIRGGETWEGTVDFRLYSKKAKVLLPTRPGAKAQCKLVHTIF